MARLTAKAWQVQVSVCLFVCLCGSDSVTVQPFRKSQKEVAVAIQKLKLMIRTRPRNLGPQYCITIRPTQPLFST